MSVMAAPNRSRITARVERVDAVEGAPKWYVAVDVLEAEAIEGGLFVRAGEAARVFVVGDEPELRPGDVFRAEVEFVGGPGGGDLQLHHLEDRRPAENDELRDPADTESTGGDDEPVVTADDAERTGRDDAQG